MTTRGVVPTTTADLVVDSRCELGEGPSWSADRRELRWLDIPAQVLHILQADGTHSTRHIDGRVTALVAADDEGGGEGLVAAVNGGVARLVDTVQGGFEIGAVIAALPPDGDGMTNDAKCDPFGRLWVGTTDRSGARQAGLFCVEPNGTVTKLRGDIGLSNGLDWSPDGRTCYYVDSLSHAVLALELSDEGFPIGATELVRTAGLPDGLTVDIEGGVWVALWDAGVVHRYSPGGQLDRIINVPGGFVTSCIFGGALRSTLYITTASEGLTGEQIADQPHAGGLFAVDVGVSGCGETSFATSTGRR